MKKYFPIILAVVVAGGICFYAGTKVGGSSSRTAGQFPNGFQRDSGTNRAGNLQSGNFAGGSIISADDKSITVKLQDGSSKIVFFSSSTEVMKSVQGALSDLVSGEQVTVAGTPNSDGSITARSIQLRAAQNDQMR
jgi:hypothetical protein